MICRQCLTRGSALVRRPRVAQFSLLTARRNAAIPKLSTPTTSSVDDAAAALPGAEKAGGPPGPGTQAEEPKSSCPAGTVLSGLNYLKGGTDPVALPDEAYPDWLWGCLELPAKPEADSSMEAEEFSKSKKQRRLVAKKQRQEMARIIATGDMESLAPKIPFEHQSINLPDGGDGALEDVLMADEKRVELKKAMRAERKRKIKENNFLRSM